MYPFLHRIPAKIPLEFKDCSINNFDTSLYQDRVMAKAARKAAANYVSNFIAFKQQGKGLYLYSKTKGSGKTRLACSIANALIQTQSIQVKFLRTLDLLDMIKDTYKKNSDLSQKEVVDGIKQYITGSTVTLVLRAPSITLNQL